MQSLFTNNTVSYVYALKLPSEKYSLIKKSLSLAQTSTLEHRIENNSKKFKIVRKNFNKIKVIIIKRFLGKATGHNDHYMINMVGQR